MYCIRYIYIITYLRSLVLHWFWKFLNSEMWKLLMNYSYQGCYGTVCSREVCNPTDYFQNLTSQKSKFKDFHFVPFSRFFHCLFTFQCLLVHWLKLIFVDTNNSNRNVVLWNRATFLNIGTFQAMYLEKMKMCLMQKRKGVDNDFFF